MTDKHKLKLALSALRDIKVKADRLTFANIGHSRGTIISIVVHTLEMINNKDLHKDMN